MSVDPMRISSGNVSEHKVVGRQILYKANAIKVMIASPNDVSRERLLIREVIHEWNAVHSEHSGIVLMPVGWETHSSPAMGARAQDVINKQVLQDCDLLIAAFWTRIGSPTGEAPSGTVEEIREHISANKPTMIYFSSAPVRADSIEDKQYSALKAFKEECKKQGLIENYESLSEFKEKLARQLAQTIIRHFDLDNMDAVEGPEVVAETRTPLISKEAEELLLAASEDSGGNVLRLELLDGFFVQSNGKQFVELGNPRSAAVWESAISELCDFGLLEAQGYKDEVFKITLMGYLVADRLRTSD